MPPDNAEIIASCTQKNIINGVILNGTEWSEESRIFHGLRSFTSFRMTGKKFCRGLKFRELQGKLEGRGGIP
jgi:hypothetical protein